MQSINNKEQTGFISALPPKAEMLKAVYGKDKSYEGIFFVAVKSTNIFCRPVCTARKPLEKNMVFYSSAREALFAGYRPCKKCRPLELSGSHPDWVKKLLESIEQSAEKRIRDGELRSMGIQPEKARRYFLKNYGITFHAYQRSRRLAAALMKIREGGRLDDVILGNGYESHSGFRDAFGKVFNKPPGKSHSTEMIVTSIYQTALGPMILGATTEGLCLAEFTDRRMLEFQLKTLNKRLEAPIIPGDNRHIEKAKQELKEYFKGSLKKFNVPLVYPGTEFQRKVWKELMKIPYGKTISYIQLAEIIGLKGASRAVGTANGMNRIGIIIPCHRVINKNGRLGGYGGGVWRKQKLIDIESKAADKR